MIGSGRVAFPRATQRFRHLGLVTGAVCLVPATVGVLAYALGLLPHDPLVFVGYSNAKPSVEYLLGCDALGRDLLSRLWAAAAYFTPPGALAVVVALVLGVILGIGESLGGRVQRAVFSWCVQVIDSLPKFVLVLLVAAIARSDLASIMAAVGLTFAPQIASAITSSVARLRAAAFIEAERSLGVGMMRIVFVHILWGHARHVILAQLMSLMAYALLVETSLSYLGGELGVQEPLPSWGNMIALARDDLFLGHLLPSLLPAAMISVTILGFTFVGQGILQLVEERR